MFRELTLRERIQKVVVLLAGLLFIAAIYPVYFIVWGKDQEGYPDAMMLTLYFVLGILLLVAVRNPPQHRSLILYAGWANIAHACVMAAMVLHDSASPDHRSGVAMFGAIGIILLMVVPKKGTPEKAIATSA